MAGHQVGRVSSNPTLYGFGGITGLGVEAQLGRRCVRVQPYHSDEAYGAVGAAAWNHDSRPARSAAGTIIDTVK